MTHRTVSSGFTAVELLITLFVAAAFLVAGYQLFNLVIKDGGDTRVEASAGNTAYDYLRRYSDSATNPCAPSTPLASSPVTIEGASSATISIAITCPQDDAPTLSKVEATVSYGVGVDAHTVKFATYVDKSRGATPNTETTDGLIGWWKLNQNADSTSGSNHGAINGATSTTGQNGQGANAFLFNGSNAYISVPTDSMSKPTDSFTVTAWFKADAIYTTGDRSIVSTTQNGGWAIYLSSACSSGMLRFQAYVNGAYAPVCTPAGSITAGTWYFAAGVYDGSSVKLYLRNSSAVSVATSGSMNWSSTSTPLCIGSEPGNTACTDGNYFDGSIDDVRFYGRALSASEVLQLYNGGAK